MVDAPIQPEFHKVMNDLAVELDARFNGPAHALRVRKVGFFLAVFHFGDPDPGKRFNYISNADKLDVEKMLSDIMERLRKRIVAGKGHTLAERSDAMARTLKNIAAGVTTGGTPKQQAESVLRFIGEMER